MSRLRWCIGYCLNDKCHSCFKGAFLLNPETEFQFICGDCDVAGYVEHEKHKTTGAGEIYTECRVSFNYNPEERKYRGEAIIRREDIMPELIYKMSSPVVKGESRALKLAEGLLSHLTNGPKIQNGAIIEAHEKTLYWDDPRSLYLINLGKIGKQWENSQKKVKD